jgi:aldehyde:ferredoxin oxidoreductase
MMVSQGYGKILDVDLSSGKIEKKDIEAEFARKYLGGVGFGCKILYDEVGPAVDPLSPENIVIFAIGPLTGSRTPGGSRTEITTKHPLSGSIGTGNTGGNWGSALKHAGYEAIIVRNKSEKPVYLLIDENNVELKDAGNLWGKDTRETTEIIPEDVSARVSVISIGQAGENLVRHACLLNDGSHAAGRCGGGAVMGSKLLKAIAVRDSGSPPPPARLEEFQSVVKEARERLMTADKAFWATGPHVPPYTLATTRMDGAPSLSQEEVEKYVSKTGPSCYACPVQCYNGIAEIKEGKYAGLTMSHAQRPAIIGLFGGVCGIDNLPAVWKCKDLCNRSGMDFYSAAGIVAFAMELYQQGIITRGDADGMELTWGNEDAVIKLLQKMATREGFGGILAEGSSGAARQIGRGAEQYLLTIKGVETGGHDPRPRGARQLNWQFLGNLTNPRGGDIIKSTHHHANQYNPNWWADQYDMFEDMKEKIYGKPPQELVTSWDGQANMYKWFEDLHSLVDSVGLCFVTSHMRLAFGPNYISRLYSAYTGIDISPQDMMKTAERLFTLFKAYGVRQGLTRKDDNWPDRYFDEPVSEGKYKGAVLPREAVDKLLDGYYEIRGWEKKTGVPTEKKLIELGLDDVAGELKELGRIP